MSAKATMLANVMHRFTALIARLGALKPSLIARMTGVSPDFVRRVDQYQQAVLIYKSSAERGIAPDNHAPEPEPIPPEFAVGRGAACYALVFISHQRPALFWIAPLAIAGIPLVLLLKLVL